MPSLIYLKLGDAIKGESTDSSHGEWIELIGFGWGVSQPVSAQSGTGGRVAGGCQFSDFSGTKIVDNASADIMKFCASGESIPKVEVEIVESTGDRHTYLKYEMENVIISGLTPTGSGGGDKPIEEVSLNFGVFKQTYTPIGNDGVAGTAVTRGWNLETGVPI